MVHARALEVERRVARKHGRGFDLAQEDLEVLVAQHAAGGVGRLQRHAGLVGEAWQHAEGRVLRAARG
jgi:hypothetical protein